MPVSCSRSDNGLLRTYFSGFEPGNSTISSVRFRITVDCAAVVVAKYLPLLPFCHGFWALLVP